MRKADEPIRKVTLNLYVQDIKDMERLYGRGWTEVVRNLVHMRLAIKKEFEDDRDR